MFKVGDKVITVKPCGIDEDVPIGTIATVTIIEANLLYISFDNIETGFLNKNRFAGSQTNPKIILLDLYIFKKINIKELIERS